MDIVWDEVKNRLLKRTQGVSFELAAQAIRNHREIAILENPVRPGQIYYIMRFNDYIHVVPALINDEEQIVLKTIFPSRKYQKLYGGNHANEADIVLDEYEQGVEDAWTPLRWCPRRPSGGLTQFSRGKKCGRIAPASPWSCGYAASAIQHKPNCTVTDTASNRACAV